MASNKPLALVTGASSGIGYELAREFAQHGFDLVIVAEDKGIVEAAQAFHGFGAEVTSVQADLAKPEGVEQVWAKFRALGRPLAAAALNAGVGQGGRFAETPLAAELNIVDLNCRSTVHLAKYVVQEMQPRGEGRILITSSIVANFPATYSAVYGASKAFTQSFAEALRAELKDTGITVTALQPGATETEFFERAGMQDTAVGQAEKDDPAKVAKDGFEALMAGKDKVVAGSFKNAVMAKAAHVLPDKIGAKLHEAQAKPGSGSK